MNKFDKEGGFTLIEVVVAMTATSILALGVMLVFTTAGVQDRDAYETTRTQTAVASLMEQVATFSYDELQLFNGANFIVNIDRWVFTIRVSQVQLDLIAVETTGRVASDENAQTIRLVTLKSVKDDSLE